MYTSLFDAFFQDSFPFPMSTVYVISDSKLEEIKCKQRQEELDNLENSRKRLEQTYQSHIKIIDERKNELQEELKALSSVKKETEKTSVKV
tara:strand:- start:170 stop:442 length:273 start_codon:yes stop_codon:yes gene_type:complete